MITTPPFASREAYARSPFQQIATNLFDLPGRWVEDDDGSTEGWEILGVAASDGSAIVLLGKRRDGVPRVGGFRV
jgi:hypothetical protein